jgi:hypothetical protein
VLDSNAKLPTSAIQDIGFSAYNPNATGTSIPNTAFTKVDFQTEEFDTHNYFASSRFTPQVAGKYQLNAFVGLISVADQGTVHVAIYKNGANHKWTRIKQSGSGELGGLISTSVDANGTTDYFEVYVYTTGGATNVGGSNSNCWFNGVKT